MEKDIESKIVYLNAAFPEFNIKEYTARITIAFFSDFLISRVSRLCKHKCYMTENNFNFIQSKYEYSDYSISKNTILKELQLCFPNVEFLYEPKRALAQNISLDIIPVIGTAELIEWKKI